MRAANCSRRSEKGGEVMGALLDIDDVCAGHPKAESELATLRANQLSPAIVEAVKAYQKATRIYQGGAREGDKRDLLEAIEADAKEREG